MTYFPNNANGQVTMANSAPVTIASDQSAVPVTATISGNPAVNLAQVTGTTTSVGNGTTDAGTQRVSISSDSTGLIFAKLKDASGNNTSVQTVGDAMAAAPTTTLGTASFSLIYNGTNFQRQVSVINATNSVGTGIAAVGNLAQFDDVSPTSITENQFGNLRMSANRNLYGTIRDAAGNERGANVTATNQLTVIDTNFPTAAALADGASNPTVPATGSFLMGYNGSAWEKVRVDIGDGLAAATGLLVANPMLYNGSTYDRQRGDSTAGAHVQVKGGLMPAGTALNTYAVRITSNTTTTPTSSTAYISSIIITTEVAGTTSTVTIRDKQGTPQVLVNGLTTTAASLSPTVINFQTPVKMTSGIDIVTAGAVAGTVDIWVNYYQ